MRSAVNTVDKCLLLLLLRRQSPGLYYRKKTVPRSYQAAKADCEADNAHLATFVTQEEYEWLMENASELERGGEGAGGSGLL